MTSIFEWIVIHNAKFVKLRPCNYVVQAVIISAAPYLSGGVNRTGVEVIVSYLSLTLRIALADHLASC